MQQINGDISPLPHLSGKGSPRLDEAFALLRKSIPFDAAELIRVIDGRPHEIYRYGYSPNAAWGIMNSLPFEDIKQLVRVHTTDGLPPTISTSDFGPDFVRSPLFQEYLAPEGYVEGLTMELYYDKEVVGLAHFSSKDPTAFAGIPREVAHSVSGLLGIIVKNAPTMVANPWTQDVFPGIREKVLADPEFQDHLADLNRLPLTSIDHLWWMGDHLVEVRVTKPDLVRVRPARLEDFWGITRQELAVLSVLCCGVSDTQVAERLDLSVRTVQSHVASLRRKLSADSRLEAVVIALGAGMFVPNQHWAPISQIVRGRPEIVA